MGDIDSVTGVHLVQLENRQLQIEKLKKLKKLKFFCLFLLLGDTAKKLNLDFLRKFDQFSILYDFN